MNEYIIYIFLQHDVCDIDLIIELTFHCRVIESAQCLELVCKQQ
jgi:hypothetical protein